MDRDIYNEMKERMESFNEVGGGGVREKMNRSWS